MSTAAAGDLKELVERGIPFLRKMPVKVEEAKRGRARLRLPFDKGNDNYVGTVHAGALFTFGETCAGLAAGTAFDLTRLRMLARRASIEYLRPATGEIAGSAEVPAEVIASAGEAIEREGRAAVPVEVAMTAQDGSPVASMTVEYHFRQVVK